ncbi:hypothetical protein GGI15_003777, partial [Coemansia interrupta]
MVRYIRQQYGMLRRSSSSQELDSVWGDILVHRMALQDYCSELIVALPSVAAQVGADRWLWRHVYHEAISECRRRLRLHVVEHNLSRTSSISTGARLSSSASSTDGSTADHGALEEWRRAWWTVTLTGLFAEALGCFSLLAQRLGAQGDGARLAARMAMYLGDVYRYQHLYLPLVQSGVDVACNTDALLGLARGAYLQALAVHPEGTRACSALALLAAYQKQPLDIVFWHARAMGYCHEGRTSACSPALLARLLAHTGMQAEDPLETLVVEYAHLVVCGPPASDAAREKHGELLRALEEDLEEIREGVAPLSLDREYWAAEYQVAVAFAALDAPELALVQMQRHVALVQQLPEECPTYALAGLALWIDLWRTQPGLLAQSSNALAVRRLLEALVNALGHTDGDDAAATDVLAHDLALQGWAALASVHRDLATERTLQRIRTYCGAVTALSPVLAQQYSGRSCAAPWDSPVYTLPVVCARARLLLACLPRVRSLVRIPDKHFCVQHAGLLAAWSAECTVVALPGMPLDGELKVVWADDKLAGAWDNVDDYLVADEEDEDVPTADDVPEGSRALIACALHWTHRVEGVRQVELASEDEELAFYASWFGISCVRSDRLSEDG